MSIHPSSTKEYLVRVFEKRAEMVKLAEQENTKRQAEEMAKREAELQKTEEAFKRFGGFFGVDFGLPKDTPVGSAYVKAVMSAETRLAIEF